MFALISPNELRGQFQRISELAEVPFDVAEPLHWIDAEDGTTIEGHAYDPTIKAIIAYTPEQEPEAIPTEVTVSQLGAALGLDSAGIDALFVEAAKL